MCRWFPCAAQLLIHRAIEAQQALPASFVLLHECANAVLLISSDAVTPFPNRFIKSLKHSSIYRRSQCVCIILYDVIYCWGGKWMEWSRSWWSHIKQNWLCACCCTTWRDYRGEEMTSCVWEINVWLTLRHKIILKVSCWMLYMQIVSWGLWREHVCSSL